MIDDVLKSIETMPAFPSVAYKALDLIRGGDYSIDDMVSVIKYDPSITANILKMSNSPYFRASQKIITIHDAVIHLGQQNLFLVIQTAGVSGFYKKPAKGYLLRPRGLWTHCVAVATMSQILSKRIYKREDPILYTAALLHDVGKIILGEFVFESMEKIVYLVSKQGYTFLEAEKEIIGINHAELGGKIADHWAFPSELRDAIANHHNPDPLDENEIKSGKTAKVTATLVFLADQICVMLGINGGSDNFSKKSINDIFEKFDLYQKDIITSISVLQDGLKQAQDLIDIVPE